MARTNYTRDGVGRFATTSGEDGRGTRKGKRTKKRKEFKKNLGGGGKLKGGGASNVGKAASTVLNRRAANRTKRRLKGKARRG